MTVALPSKTAFTGQRLSEVFCEDLRRYLGKNDGETTGTPAEIVQRVLDSSARLQDDALPTLTACFQMRVNANCRQQLGMVAEYVGDGTYRVVLVRAASI